MIREIYIPLLGEDIDVWRPAQAYQIDENRYKILAPIVYGTKNEQWKFIPGSIVHCEYVTTTGGDRIFAAIYEEK